jgi:plasmid stability protein
MGDLHLRDLDESVLRELTARAAESGLSVEEQAKLALAEAVGRQPVQLLERMRAFQERIGRLPGPSSTEILRRMRDEDAPGARFDG